MILKKHICPDYKHYGVMMIFYGGKQLVCPNCSEVFDIPKRKK